MNTRGHIEEAYGKQDWDDETTPSTNSRTKDLLNKIWQTGYIQAQKEGPDADTIIEAQDKLITDQSDFLERYDEAIKHGDEEEAATPPELLVLRAYNRGHNRGQNEERKRICSILATTAAEGIYGTYEDEPDWDNPDSILRHIATEAHQTGIEKGRKAATKTVLGQDETNNLLAAIFWLTKHASGETAAKIIQEATHQAWGPQSDDDDPGSTRQATENFYEAMKEANIV